MGAAGGETELKTDVLEASLDKKRQLELDLPARLMDPDTSAIVNFFYKDAKTSDDVTYNQMLRYSYRDAALSKIYIPYLLPSTKRSEVARSAPLANVNTCEIFKLNPPLRDAYLQGIRKVLNHWELKLNADNLVTKASHFSAITAPWLNSRNTDEPMFRVTWNLKVERNYKLPNDDPVTRMMQSLAILGFNDTAKAYKS